MSCERRYHALESDRDYYLERARTAAGLTIPYLIPISNEPTGRENNTFPLPWNGIGARGVHNLASRLLLALLNSGAQQVVQHLIRSVTAASLQQSQQSGSQAAKTDMRSSASRTAYLLALASRLR